MIVRKEPDLNKYASIIRQVFQEYETQNIIVNLLDADTCAEIIATAKEIEEDE